jgi:hypothetical protein
VSVVTFVLTATLACGNQVAGGEKKAAAIYQTPQEVFEVARAAVNKDDWRAFLSCFTDDSRDSVAGLTLFVAGLVKEVARLDKSAAARQTVKQLDLVFKKHGLTEAILKKQKAAGNAKDSETALRVLRAGLEPVKDRSAFILDMFAAMRGYVKEIGKAEASFKEMIRNAELRELEVKGDKATAVLLTTRDGQRVRESIEFRRLGGSWRMVVPLRLSQLSSRGSRKD